MLCSIGMASDIYEQNNTDKSISIWHNTHFRTDKLFIQWPKLKDPLLHQNWITLWHRATDKIQSRYFLVFVICAASEWHKAQQATLGSWPAVWSYLFPNRYVEKNKLYQYFMKAPNLALTIFAQALRRSGNLILANILNQKNRTEYGHIKDLAQIHLLSQQSFLSILRAV